MTPDPPAADIHGRDLPAGAVVFEEGDLRARRHALAASELAAVPDLAAAGPEEVAAGLLGGRLPPDDPRAGAAEHGGLDEHLAVKRRLEPGARGRTPT